MKKAKLKKILAIIGIILVVIHLTYYFLNPYSFVYFILGFALIYVVFVLPVKYIK